MWEVQVSQWNSTWIQLGAGKSKVRNVLDKIARQIEAVEAAEAAKDSLGQTPQIVTTEKWKKNNIYIQFF